MLPQDLLEYGFIPEMVGRLPVTVALEPLDRSALIQVLTEPKNAIVKQYQQLFSIDGVELEFTQDGLEAAADSAVGHPTGARCLRYIIECALLDVMYELPSLKDVVRCVIDKDVIEGNNTPTLVTEGGESFNLSLDSSFPEGCSPEETVPPDASKARPIAPATIHLLQSLHEPCIVRPPPGAK